MTSHRVIDTNTCNVIGLQYMQLWQRTSPNQFIQTQQSFYALRILISPMVYYATAYLMFYAPLQLAGCFVAHMYGGASRMLRSKGLLRESSGSWYAWAF